MRVERYTKKPDTLNAVRITRANIKEMVAFFHDRGLFLRINDDCRIAVSYQYPGTDSVVQAFIVDFGGFICWPDGAFAGGHFPSSEAWLNSNYQTAEEGVQ